MERREKLLVAEMLGVGLLRIGKIGRWKEVRILLPFSLGQGDPIRTYLLPSTLNFSNPCLPARFQVWEEWSATYWNATLSLRAPYFQEHFR